MRQKYEVQKSIGFTEDLVDKIETVAEKLNSNFSEIVRECVINDLPKLIDRETKARKARKVRRKSL